eukprot:TRINITY_DN11927_c0_g1_i6.p1 TRINITY_DN11927_c0_g1~~TRINITY_DN11927_c0_g1_i6.p1  ORF type:complete len:184 (+),score=58.94 TRINITY_DN11927_c0_g1_i6:129-680(+)
MIRRPPRSTQGVSSAASDVYKRQYQRRVHGGSSNSVNRNLPSAMKSRPKIPRTPINEGLLGLARRDESAGDHGRKMKPSAVQPSFSPKAKVFSQGTSQMKPELKVEDSKEQRAIIKTIPEEEAKDAKQEEEHKGDGEFSKTQEFKFAFGTREKIVRTPPTEEKDYPKKLNNISKYYPLSLIHI